MITERLAIEAAFRRDAVPDPDSYPVSDREGAEEVRLPQKVLLGDRSDMDDVVTAIHRIRRAWA